MSTAIPPMPQEAAEPKLSEPQRIINAFIAPSKTFEDIRRNQSWWVPYLLSAIVATCFFVTVGRKVGWDTVARDVAASTSSFQQASPDLQEKQIRMMSKGYQYGSEYGSVVILLVFVLIEGALLMVAFNFILEAAVPFRTSLAIVFYGSLPLMLSSLLGIVSLLISNGENFNFQNPVASNLAYFLDRSSTSKFWYSVATSFDVFSIWVVILIGMGFAINSDRKRVKVSTGIVTVAVLFFIWKLIAAGAAGLRG